ncbi:MAG: hypothetical protein QY322_01105 [bacterium]|nr:MAG: hypothetical protein QY322_01105 [bacterium]
MDDLDSVSNDELWLLYANSVSELRKRGLVRTNNIIGDRGEFLVVSICNSKPNYSKLQLVQKGTKNIDATSNNGDRYSIKTMSEPNKTTGVFHGMGNPGDVEIPEKKFEYLILVQIDKNYMPKLILELTWDQFLKFRHWHKTMRAWNISITKLVCNNSNILYNK